MNPCALDNGIGAGRLAEFSTDQDWIVTATSLWLNTVALRRVLADGRPTAVCQGSIPRLTVTGVRQGSETRPRRFISKKHLAHTSASEPAA